jgi:hypothetical protein
MSKIICQYEDDCLCYKDLRGDTEIDCDKCEVKLKTQNKS